VLDCRELILVSGECFFARAARAVGGLRALRFHSMGMQANWGARRAMELQRRETVRLLCLTVSGWEWCRRDGCIIGQGLTSRPRRECGSVFFSGKAGVVVVWLFRGTGSSVVLAIASVSGFLVGGVHKARLCCGSHDPMVKWGSWGAILWVCCMASGGLIAFGPADVRSVGAFRGGDDDRFAVFVLSISSRGLLFGFYCNGWGVRFLDLVLRGERGNPLSGFCVPI